MDFGDVPALSEIEEATGAVTVLPRLPAPPLPVIVGFGVVYALIFGPVNIWMLRRMRRTVRAWLVMPSLALLMTLVVLVVGEAWGKASTALNGLSLLYTQAGSRSAAERSLVGLFSPTNRAFDISVAEAGATFQDRGSPLGPGAESLAGGSELPWPRLQHEDSLRWDALPLQLYSVRVLELTAPRELGGTVMASLRPAAGGALAGSLRNGTSLALRDAWLIHGKQTLEIGDLAPGKPLSVAATGWTNRSPELSPAGREGTDTEQAYAERLAALWKRMRTGAVGEEAWLLGRLQEPAGSIQVAGVPFNHQAALVLVRIPMTEKPTR